MRAIKCCLVLGDITEAETILTKLLEFDPMNKTITGEQNDLIYVQKHLKDAEAAYNAKDYRKVWKGLSHYLIGYLLIAHTISIIAFVGCILYGSLLRCKLFMYTF